MAGLRNEGIFTPPSLEGTLAMPSNIGGAHWGGVAADNQSGIVVVPVNRVAAVVQLIPAKGFDLSAARQESSRLGQGYEYTMMEGTPYIMRRRILLGPGQVPCTPPPFGALVAVNLRTGGKLWDVPLGTPPLPPGAPAPPMNLGMPNLGGPIDNGGTPRLHRGDARSHVPRIRPRQRQRALEDTASRRRPRDADDIRSGRTSVRSDCGGWRE